MANLALSKFSMTSALHAKNSRDSVRKQKATKNESDAPTLSGSFHVSLRNASFAKKENPAKRMPSASKQSVRIIVQLKG